MISFTNVSYELIFMHLYIFMYSNYLTFLSQTKEEISKVRFAATLKTVHQLHENEKHNTMDGKK